MDKMGYVAAILGNKYKSASPYWTKGDLVQHPDGYMVKIIFGCYRDSTYNRISNWWEWRRVYTTGRITKKVYSGYGW